MSTRPPPASRSWGGCVRCRKRRQKCDEQKPACQRCLAATVGCEYQAPLKWGGRAFSSSRFGKVLGESNIGGVKKLKIDNGAFIYTVPTIQRTRGPKTRPPSEEASAAVGNVEETADAQVIEEPAEDFKQEREGERTKKIEEHRNEELEKKRAVPHVLDQIQLLPTSTAFERQLLHHFVHNASRATSCHSLVQQDVCRMILPMAMDSPALLSATLVLSAIHQKSLSSAMQVQATDRTIAGLKTTSLRHLRCILAQPQHQDLNVILATVRTLCLTEVYDGSHKSNSWRAHFDGARALIESHTAREEHVEDSGPADLLRRWFSVTEALIALTPDSIPTTAEDESDVPAIGLRLTTDNTADEEDGCWPSNVYLDEYTGCSTDLSGLFRDIGTTIKIHQSKHDYAQDRTCSKYSCNMSARRLEWRIREMLTRDQVGKVVFNPKTAIHLSRRQALEFALCNRAYQHTALLHIQRRLFDLPTAHHEVQETVGIIIGCVEDVHLTEGLSPMAVLTTPVFVAGCEAFGTDRARVRKILDAMYSFLRIPNMRRALEILEEYWKSAQGERSLSWAQFAKLHDYDFLPY